MIQREQGPGPGVFIVVHCTVTGPCSIGMPPFNRTVSTAFTVPVFPSSTNATPSMSGVGSIASTSNVSLALSPSPSVTVTVMVAVPVWFGAGVTVTVRFPPLPPKTMFTSGTSA